MTSQRIFPDSLSSPNEDPPISCFQSNKCMRDEKKTAKSKLERFPDSSSPTLKVSQKRLRERSCRASTTNGIRRRSSRGNSSLSNLAYAVVSNKNVVFITGAGLSVNSGIRPFRGEDGVWSEVIWNKSTRDAFRRDPKSWYNDFWLRHFPPNYNSFEPNKGHEALAEITNLLLPAALLENPVLDNTPSSQIPEYATAKKPFSASISKASNNVRIITQNVDGLHSRTKCQWDHEAKLIEAHGRVGLYKCIPEEDSDTDSDSDEEEDRPVKLGSLRKYKGVLSRLKDSTTQGNVEKSCDLAENEQSSSAVNRSRVCRYEIQDSIRTDQLHPPSVRSVLSYPSPAQDFTETDPELQPNVPTLELSSAPLCPSCSRPSPPQSLLFDEGYHSHSHYQFLQMETWLSEAEILVFVGTSFTVTITDVALAHARSKGIPVYNFNVERLSSTSVLNVENIMGDASETLVSLQKMCSEEVEKMRRFLG